ncbi:hypothetical protein B7494_g7572 [Chlorociboria aeruginascens]|nr:hypothetical protein B7494_g7572 [Chlorociboria aeruginascens]
MRLPINPADAAFLSILLLPLLTHAVGNINCEHVRVDKTDFDLRKLGGPRSVMHSVDQDLSLKNTTYTIDICRPLERSGKVPKEEQCPSGTRVCGIERFVKDDTDTIERVIPIAGELLGKGKGGNMDAKWTRLSTSKSHADSDKEGLRLEMNGGYTGNKKLSAIVEFICDHARTGLENLYDPEDKYKTPEAKREDKDEDEDEDKEKDGDEEPGEVDEENTSSLQFYKYTEDDTSGTLRLVWRTKYACEGSKEEEDKKVSHWGFFTWFIIIAFLGIATYLIFGSWLNYNRYGARGWDLLPHSDTIRDVPYLAKDWSRRVLTTVQGGGSRGGYAAV